MVGETVKDLWGSLLLRGIMATVFGVAAVFWPGVTIVTIVYLFSAFILASGLVGLIAGLLASKDTALNRVLTIVGSLIEVGVGVYLFRHPLVSFNALILIIGFTLIMHGIFEVVAGIFESGSATFKLLSIISGSFAVLAGVFMFFQREAAGVAFVWVLGLYALLAGAILITLAFDIKNTAERLTTRK